MKNAIRFAVVIVFILTGVSGVLLGVVAGYTLAGHQINIPGIVPVRSQPVPAEEPKQATSLRELQDDDQIASEDLRKILINTLKRLEDAEDTIDALRESTTDSQNLISKNAKGILDLQFLVNDQTISSGGMSAVSDLIPLEQLDAPPIEDFAN